jgi:GT2 family glycosyltransferase
VTVAGVVVSHGPEPELAECLHALAAQVDELVLVLDVPGDAMPALPPSAVVIRNDRSRGFAANANRGVAATSKPFVVIANADTVPAPDAVALLAAFAARTSRCGVAGPQLRYPDGRWQPSRRRFPTVRGTLLRRTPLRRLFRAERWQRAHYLFDERPSQPARSDWMLGAFMLFRRAALDELGGFDEGFRLYGEDIELCYRMAKAGWERWYVPDAVVQHTYPAVTDHAFFTRRTLWHWRSVLHFARKHPERLLAL